MRTAALKNRTLCPPEKTLVKIENKHSLYGYTSLLIVRKFGISVLLKQSIHVLYSSRVRVPYHNIALYI